MSPRHIALAALVAVIWGLNFVVIKLGLEEIPPLLLTALRYGLAAPAVLFFPRPPAPWRVIVAVGVFLGAVSFGFLFLGVKAGMPAGLASLTMQAQIFFTLIFAAAFLGERPRPAQLAGLALGVLGVALIGVDLETTGGGGIGALALVVAGAAGWGAANIVMKRAGAVDPFRLMLWMSLIPPIPLLALSWIFEGSPLDALARVGWTGMGSALYNAWVAHVLAFGLWAALLRRYPASTVAPFSLMVPVFGFAFAALIVGEAITPLKIVAAALVVSGLALNAVRARRSAQA